MKHEPNYPIADTTAEWPLDDETDFADLIVCRNADNTWAVFLHLPDASMEADGFATRDEALAWADGEVEAHVAQESRRRQTPARKATSSLRGDDLPACSGAGQEV